MKISESAKKVISSALDRSGKDYLHIGLIDRCHNNKSLDIRLIEKDEAENLTTICEIEVDIDEKAKEFLSEFTLEGQDNGIMFIPPSNWKNEHEGCCHSNDSHKGGEGCCHSSHHSESGNGCCCGEGDNGCCCQNND